MAQTERLDSERRRLGHSPRRRQVRSHGPDKRVILLVVFVVACVTAVVILARACGLGQQPQQPPASVLTYGVYVSSRTCGTDEQSGRGPALVVSGVYS
jgi:hypothetical protein